MEENNKDYLKGLLTGLVTGVLIVLLVFTGIRLKNVITDNIDKQTDNSSGKEATIDSIEKKMDAVYEQLDEMYLNEIDMEEMEDAVCGAMLDSLGDPYSVYYSEEELEALLESTTGEYCGIGVAVGQQADTKKIIVTTVFSTSPAKKAGIKPGDEIIGIDDKDVADNSLDTVVSWVKGEEGSEVTIRVLRNSEELEFTMKRSPIEIDTVYYEMLDDNIGYVEIAEFDEVTMNQFSRAVEDLKSKGMEKIIIDLRDNPGGRMDVICNVVNTFLEKDKLILYTEDKNGKREEEHTLEKGELIGMPLVLLVNGNSASASEVFTGVVKDYEIGTVIGTKTFGKGIVQKLIGLNDNTALKITYSKYYTPGGKNIHGEGIEPHIEVELPDKKESPVLLEKGEKDTQLERAKEVLEEK